MGYIHKLRSGKAICFVKVEQLYSGKYALQRRLVHSDKWEWVMSLPIFDSKEQAEKYMKEHYEQIVDE